MPTPELISDSGAGRYRLLVDGTEVGFVEVDPIGEHAILLKHTEVLSAFEGKGYGSQLVSGVLDDIRRQGKTVVPICPYAMNFIRKHREYLDVVRADMRGTV